MDSERNYLDPQPSTSRETTVIDNTADLDEVWNKLREIFPDADPDFLFDKVQEHQENLETLQEIIAVLLENRNYPRLKDTLKRQKQEIIKRKYMEREVSINDFLEISEDPVSYFYNYNLPRSENYKEHVTVQLCNDFPYVQEETIRKTMQKFNYSLTKSYRELQNLYVDGEPHCKHSRIAMKNKVSQHFRYQKKLPEDPDELFYKELAFLQSETVIRDYLNYERVIRQSKIDEARKKGELITCCCCYEDEFLIEEILLCDDGHMFCKDCVRRSSEEVIGQGKFKFPCLAPDCKTDLPLSTLQQALKPTIFSNLIQRMQEAEIQEANISDLLSCPFCSFCAIVPNPNDKVFKCLNPECGKESCRFCKELNHVPLRCEEVEKQAEVNMRTFIENKMTDALLRTCPKCNKRFIKENGCNKMTCVCGACMCYVCRKIINGYDHFGPGRCPQYSTDVELHDKVVKKEAEEARKKFLSDHPELKNIELKHDPVKNLNEFPDEISITNVQDDYNDSDSSSDEDSFGSSHNDFSETDFNDSEDGMSLFTDEETFSSFDLFDNDSECESVINISDSESEKNELNEAEAYLSSCDTWQSSTETISSSSSDECNLCLSDGSLEL